MNFTELEKQTLDELRGTAKDFDIVGYNHMKKQDLVLRLMRAHAEKRGLSVYPHLLCLLVQAGSSPKAVLQVRRVPRL